MNANELAKLLEVDNWRQQAEQIENLKQWERRHLDVIEKQQSQINQQQEEKKALYNLVAEQDKKIIELAFKLAYAERSNEIVLEANTRSRP